MGHSDGRGRGRSQGVWLCLRLMSWWHWEGVWVS